MLPTPEPTVIAPGAAPPSCGFGPFDPLGFIGETTLAGAGIPASPELHDLPGMLYVTDGPAQVLPMQPEPKLRGYCMVYSGDDAAGNPAEGHIMTLGVVPDAWQPPR